MWFAEPEKFRVDLLGSLVAKATGGDLHIALEPEAVWRSDELQARVNREITELYDRFSGEPDDREEPDLATIAGLLSQPPEACYGWIVDARTGVKLSVLVAGNSWLGLIAIREGEDVWVRTFRPERLSAVLADVLPEGTWKAHAQPISVLRSEMLAAKRDYGPTPSAEVRRAQRFAALAPHTSAEFNVETRKDGVRRRSPLALRVYDTENGRWALRMRPYYDDERMDLTPASSQDVANLLDELRRDLVR
jgi:hypothetical protein